MSSASHETALPRTHRATPAGLENSQRNQQRDILLAAVVVVIATLLFQQAPSLATRPHLIISDNILYQHALLRCIILLLGGLTTGWLAQPSLSSGLRSLRDRASLGTRRALTVIAVACACGFVATLLIVFGRRQFGAWDFGILIETGYRQMLGQRPYVDFAAPTPPFFNSTAALAFRLFGLRWDANLYLAALFSTGTLVWSFALLRRLRLGTFAALGTATLVQIAAMLTCAFWWYNNATLILAGVFFLSSLLLVESPRSRLAQASFVTLVAVLPLTKPNIAGVTLLGCSTLLLICSRRRTRIALLLVTGAVGCGMLLLALRIPVGAMLATYHAISRERGGLSTFGFNSLSPGERYLVILWTCALCSPMLLLYRPLLVDLQAKRWRQACYWLFFPLAALVGIYGLLGNGEYRDVEFPLLICAIALLAFRDTTHPRMRRFTVALLCAMGASDLYYGAARLRVFTVGPHAFFEWGNDQQVLTHGFFQNLHASSTLVETDREVRAVTSVSQAPLFLGPRLDFEYAALGLQSPTGWATFFQPGTAFGRDATPTLVRAWEAHRFQTLVFLKENYTFFPEDLLNTLARDYIRDDRHAHVSVYRRRPGR